MWTKQGRIFYLEPNPCRTTHVQVPTPYVMKDRIRVFYASRTLRNKSFPAYFDLDFDLKTIIGVHEKPIMHMGKPGNFDADGVMPSCCVDGNLFYIGWSELKNTARYQNEIGLAHWNAVLDRFNRTYQGPIMGRSPTEPGLAVMPFVMKEGNMFRCWYQSLIEWIKVGSKYEPVYLLKYAESKDGIEWKRLPQACVAADHNQEAFSRPSVIKDGDMYKMWYCYRDSNDYRGGGGSYRIGYADSTNGVSFIRKDYEAGISVGEKEEWDSDMIAYPYVFELEGKRVMLYNGNAFGQTGVGLAIWE